MNMAKCVNAKVCTVLLLMILICVCVIGIPCISIADGNTADDFYGKVYYFDKNNT